MGFKPGQIVRAEWILLNVSRHVSNAESANRSGCAFKRMRKPAPRFRAAMGFQVAGQQICLPQKQMQHFLLERLVATGLARQMNQIDRSP